MSYRGIRDAAAAAGKPHPLQGQAPLVACNLQRFGHPGCFKASSSRYGKADGSHPPALLHSAGRVSRRVCRVPCRADILSCFVDWSSCLVLSFAGSHRSRRRDDTERQRPGDPARTWIHPCSESLAFRVTRLIDGVFSTEVPHKIA